MALQSSPRPVSRRRSAHPFKIDTQPSEWLDSGPFLAWYDNLVGYAGPQARPPRSPATLYGGPSIEDRLSHHGTNSRRMSAARVEGRVTMNVVLAALEALDPWTDPWELAWQADMAVRELVPFRDAHGRDLLEPAIAAVEKWHRWS